MCYRGCSATLMVDNPFLTKAFKVSERRTAILNPCWKWRSLVEVEISRDGERKIVVITKKKPQGRVKMHACIN